MAQVPALKYQEGNTIDYTPAAAVTAGDVVVNLETVGIATNDIAANVLGSLDVVGTFKVPKVTGAIAKDAKVYWGAASDPVSGTAGTGAAAATGVGPYMGTAAAAALSGDAYVIVRLGVPSKDEVPGASTAAAGSTTSDAGVLPAATSRVYLTSGADDTKGVRINAADQVTGRKLYIANGVSNKILKVYGPSGAVINGASADAAFSSASGAGVTIICTSGSGNTWAAF